MEIRRHPPNPAINVSQQCYQVSLPEGEPQHVLERIVWQKERAVDRWREALPLQALRQQIQQQPDAPRDFLGALRQARLQPAPIAEIKQASPSRGTLCAEFDPVAIARAYREAGAACLSVLTEQDFFQGSLDHLAAARAETDLPVLCKDFILYPYQLYLARTYGADAALLIAALLRDQDLRYFVRIANSLGMAPLVEVHTLAELDRVLAVGGISLIGINNRNLSDFSVEVQVTERLLQARGEQLRERGIAVVSESGLHAPADLAAVARAGADAVLVGESLLTQPHPGQALGELFANQT